MSGSIKRIDVRALKAALHDGLEIAFLDAREEQTFGERHILMAACMPLGRIEVLADDMVPRRRARVVWCDDGGGLGERAAQRMADLGYSDVSVLDGGVAAWESTGFRIYSGVHVPSKGFAEVVEHDLGTPWITATELKALIDAGRDIAILDSRSFAEYHSNSIPTAVSVPGAELLYRFKDLVPSPSTMVIVNCGGRTRSIIGAQSLINAGVHNKVVSLKDGTMAWHLAGFNVIQGADRRPPEVSPASAEVARQSVERIASGLGIPRIGPATLAAWRAESDRRSLYLLDVRTPEEYEAGHVAGIRSAPGGQLVQESDNYLATWGARVVLADTDGVRAAMTASWLKQMGWGDVAVMRLEDVPGTRVTGPHRPLALGLERAQVAAISPVELKRRLEAGTVTLIDLEYSKLYRNGHIPGAWFATRTRLGVVLEKLPPAESIVLTSPDGDLARIAAAELARTAALPVHALEGGTRAWSAAGYHLAKDADRMADAQDDVWLGPRERGSDRESAMRAYLAWEIDLVNQMATDDDQRFNVVKVFGSDGVDRESLMTSIVGTWRLVRAEAFDANGKPQPAPYGGAPTGRVMFTSSGRMMAMTGDGRQEARADQIREYNTYAGNYTFDGKRLVTRVDSCSNPAYMGTEQVREVSHEGGLMVLRPPVRAYVGRPPEQRVLYWERISDIDG